MACKAAVKGHDLLSEQEMIKLVEDLRYINDPFHCPHGRPTIIKFTNYDLEKKFRRIVQLNQSLTFVMHISGFHIFVQLLRLVGSKSLLHKI